MLGQPILSCKKVTTNDYHLSFKKIFLVSIITQHRLCSYNMQ